MLTLYFSPGACSMAGHIVLEETGEKYQAQRVNFADAEQRSEAYLKLNPQGRVPTLLLDDGEPLARTQLSCHIGKRFGLWRRTDRRREGSFTHWLLATSVHPSVAHMWRPERYAADTSVHPLIQDAGRKTFDGISSRSTASWRGGDGSRINIPSLIPICWCSTCGDCAGDTLCRSRRLYSN